MAAFLGKFAANGVRTPFINGGSFSKFTPCAVSNLMHGVGMKAPPTHTSIHITVPNQTFVALRDMAASRATTKSVVIADALKLIQDKDSDGNAYNAALDRRLTQFGDALMARLDLLLSELFTQMTNQVRGDLASAVASLSGASVRTTHAPGPPRSASPTGRPVTQPPLPHVPARPFST